MRYFVFLILALLIDRQLQATQGVYIPPRNHKSHPTIVHMTIGDNIVPLIEIGDRGPTVVGFPGKVVGVYVDKISYDYKVVAPIGLKDRGAMFHRVLFSVSPEITQQDRDFLAKEAISVIVVYQHQGKELVHDVELIYRPKRRRAFVTLLPAKSSVKINDDMIGEFEKHGFDARKVTNQTQEAIRADNDEVLKTFELAGYELIGGGAQ